jgi:hypothetical protein
VNYGTICKWVPKHIPRPYQSVFDVPDEWVPERVTPREAERLLDGRLSYLYYIKNQDSNFQEIIMI